MEATMEDIMLELKSIRSELNYIKEHMADKDCFMSPEEFRLIQESYKNEKDKKLVSSKDLRKEL